MDSALRQREQSYRRADALLDEFDHLTVSAEGLRSALGQVELRLQQAGGYFITEEQAETILDQIAEVGADLPRFCAFVGVDGIALIPAHEFETALAALEAKRESVRRVA